MKKIVLASIISLAVSPTCTKPQQKKEAHEIANMQELRTILSDKQPTLLLFYAPWCGACKAMKGPFNSIAEKFKDRVQVVKINADNEQLKEATDAFGIEAIPTLIIKNVGILTEKNLETLLNQLIPEQEKKDTKPKAKPVKKVQKNTVTKKALSKKR